MLEVAVPVPLRRTFDFLLMADGDMSAIEVPAVGTRVLVPFGGRKLVGLIVAIKEYSDLPRNKLKPVFETLDTEPVFDAHLLQLIRWMAGYYLAPIGEVTDLAMPQLLRQGRELTPVAEKQWRLSDHGRSSAIEELHRAPLQLAIVKRFMKAQVLRAVDFKQQSGGWRQAVAALLEKGWLNEDILVPELIAGGPVAEKQIELNAEQAGAVDHIRPVIQHPQFVSNLLHGVTGSGKTEVYIALMREVLATGRQCLLLVPEIGLTPQLITRVQEQLICPLAVMHSALTPGERHLAWWHARSGAARVVIGTRSAVFAPLPELGMIVVDEEHDGSFKQQDGVRYHARDVAVYRAKMLGIPILLGSATPSLESYQHAISGRYQRLALRERATRAQLPEVDLLDLNQLPLSDGLSPPLIEAISNTLAQSQQVMLYLNRRGFAPVMMCADCRHTLSCHRCDSHLTYHQRINRLRCHHCGYEAKAPEHCQACDNGALVEVGEGTQRVEQALQQRFPDARVLRIDRDSTRRRGELQELLEQASSGAADILLGTQLLSKGHDFPAVALVGVLNADQGLYSTDFRASEHLFQQLVQVAGRAGRRAQAGRVLIQTRFPEHPFFDWVKQHDFAGFAEHLLAQRQAHQFPPFGYFAILRAESTHQAKALQFLRHAKSSIPTHTGLSVLDPVPAPMERRAGRYRAQLLLTASRRSILHSCAAAWLDHMAEDAAMRKLAGAVRWSLDVDPLDLY
ncbi:MAG: primosomal protein N' [Gammaproteobacteria bacterium]|nr:primosomal protein N' [Gammaproteobacteria bacterium]